MTARSDSLYDPGPGVSLAMVVFSAMLAVSSDAGFADYLCTPENNPGYNVAYISIACSW